MGSDEWFGDCVVFRDRDTLEHVARLGDIEHRARSRQDAIAGLQAKLAAYELGMRGLPARAAEKRKIA